MRQALCKKLWSAALFAVTLCALPALASPDWYWLGDGKDGSKTITGEESINLYTRVTSDLSAGATFIPVTSSTDFKPGRLVMVYQATGLTSKSSKNTDINISKDSAGRWELARLSDTVGFGMLHLASPLVHSYAAGATQVISVPEYSDVTVSSTGILTGPAWNKVPGDKATGGVLAFLATGEVKIEGRVDMKAKGFPGGQYVATTACPGEGQKGKGIAYQAGEEDTYVGRDRLANGGGGGVCDQSGGGGGGNGGMGGQGGNSATGKMVGGLGGGWLEVGKDYDALTHLSLGGGGGAGHGTRAVLSSEVRAGGAGGGIIFIRGRTLTVTDTGFIRANGEDGQGVKDAAIGGNGGGAGGSIYLRFSSEVACARGAKVEAKGGEGSHTKVDNKTFLGPGGGGGGGFARLQYSRFKVGNACVLDTSGGQGGQPENTPPGDDSRYGAKGGNEGKEVYMDTGFPILPAPVVDSPANGIRIRETRPSYSGTFSRDPKDTQVLVYVSDFYVKDRKEGEKAMGPFMTWSLDSSRELLAGSYTVHAVALNTREAVASVPSNSNSFTVDTTRPQVSVTTPTEGSRTRDTTPVYEGTVTDDGPVTVMVSVGGASPEPATVTGNTWRYMPREPLAAGPHTVMATATDAAGLTAMDAKEFTVDATRPQVSVRTPTENLRTRDTTPVYEGTVSDDGPVTVMVSVGGASPEPATVSGNTWRYTPRDPLAAGSHTVMATATDDVGNTATDANTFTVDTTVAVTVTTPGKDSRSRETLPECTGTVLDDGPGPMTVMVSVDGAIPEPATVTGNTWSYTPKVPLSPGSHTVKVTTTDDVGNTATDSNDFTIVDRNYYGDGIGCAASGGTPSALAMMGLAVLSALLVRRRQR
jgi:uncharacterized protein (TIGR03382 family)